jgi:Kef-type K+ transport system membrane component KefB
MELPDDVFFDVAAILLICALVGAVAARLRQPLVFAFVLVGVVVGPSVLGLVRPGEELELLAEIGVAVLLFTVGLKLDLHVVRRLGPVATAAALVQMAATAAGGFLLARLLGLDGVEALYVAIGLAFSSTILVVKLLTDLRQLDDLHGRISLGILIVQDIAVIVALVAITASGASGESLAAAYAEVAVEAAAFLAVIAALTRWALTPLLHRIAGTPDLLVLFAIAWAVMLGAIGEQLELGTEVGAFVGGVSLATTPYREALAARLLTVRDFLLLFFFIELGSRIDVAEAADQLLTALLLAAFVLVVKPVTVALVLAAFRYRRRVAVETGLSLAQISEFSLILAALGLSLDHIDESTATLLTVVALLTFGASTYLILNGERLARALAQRPWLPEREAHPDHELEPDEAHDVVVLGVGRYGGAIVHRLADRGLRVLAVDFDPRALAAWQDRGVDVLYGDAEDPELPRALPLPHDGWIVSTVRRLPASLALIHALDHAGYRGRLAVAAHDVDAADRLIAAGADAVLHPYEAAGEEAVQIVTAEGPEASAPRDDDATETSAA